MKKFLNALIILSIFFVSCKMEYDVLKRDSNIESISVDTSAAKKNSYVVSESFDPTGLKVIAHYTDGTTQEVDLAQVTFENFSSEKANPALPITAKYLEFTTTFEICIKENEIVKIEVIQTPHKLHYQQNDSPEYKGLLVVGVDKLQKRRVLKEDEYAVTNFGYSNANAAGNNQLTISYNKNPEIKDFFIIFFDDWMINEVKVTEPSKKVYIKGQQKLQDIEVKVKKNNEKNYVTLTSMQYSIEPGDFTLLEARKDQVVTVWVNEKYDSFKVDIVDTYVSGIEVDKEFYKDTAFFDGEEINFFNKFSFYEKLEKTDDIENVRGDKITEQFLIDNNSELKCKYNGKETNIDKNDSKIKLTGTGIQTLEFLYTFYDIKTNKNITVSSFIEIFVGKSELSSISATWNGNGYPLGVTPDNSNSAYGTWKISLKFVNGITKSVESGKCSFEYKAGEIEKIKDAVLNGSTKNCPVIVKYADKQTEVNVMVKCPDVLGITAKLNGNNNKFRKGDTKLREYITANKILQFISDTPKIAANDISVDMIEINGSSESNGLLKVEYSNSGKTFSDFIDVKIIDPRINLASNNISVSLINNCDFSALTDNLKIYESGSDIKKKLELLTEEKYSITEKKWKLYISARQKIEAYGDTEQYSTIKSLECSYSYTEQGQNFNINNIKVSREYKIDDKIIKKQLTKDTDFFVYTDNYTVQDEYGNKITEYTKPQQPQGGN